MTITQTITLEKKTSTTKNNIIVLKLKSRKRVTWDENVIDNEFLNKKKSNCCCVYCKKIPSFLPKDAKKR